MDGVFMTPSPIKDNELQQNVYNELISFYKDENHNQVDAILTAIIDSLPEEHPKPGFHPEFNQEYIGWNSAISETRRILTNAKSNKGVTK